MKSISPTLLCLIVLISMISSLQLNLSYGLPSGEGAKIDLYTQRGGEGPGVPSDAFAPDMEVILYANVTYNDAPVRDRIAVFEVNGPINSVENISFIRTALTEANGVTNASFRIPQPPDDAKETVFGFWKVTATVEIGQVQVRDDLSFQVSWILEIISAETVDAANVSKNSFRRDEQVHFRVRVKNIAETDKVVILIVNTFDNANTFIGKITLGNQSAPPGITSYLSEDLALPKMANLGNATAYALAFTALPAEGGKLWSPGVSTTFEILPEISPPPPPPTELSWLLLLILIIALAGGLLSGFIIQRRRRRRGKPPSSEPTYLEKPYKRLEKRTKAAKSHRSSYICPSCGLYHLPWREN